MREMRWKGILYHIFIREFLLLHQVNLRYHSLEVGEQHFIPNEKRS